MNVLFISSDNNKTSGAFRCLVEINHYIRQYTDINTIVVLPKNGDGVELLDQYNIPYVMIPSYSWITYKGIGIKAVAKTIFKAMMVFYNLYAITKIRALIKKEKIDIVHTNTIFSYVGAYAAYKENIPHLWHLREDIYKGYNSRVLNSNYGYGLIKKSSYIIAVSNVIKKAYEKKMLPKEISVVYDGVSAELYNEREILKKSKTTFTCIGAFVSHKNQSELIKACHVLKDKGIRNFQVKLVGRGPDEAKLKKLVQNFNLENEVEFCGIYDDIKEILEITDVLCVTSISEAFGRTTVEGMLQGCLVVGAESEQSATHELIEHGVNGYLYESGNVAELSERLLMCSNSDNFNKLRLIARQGQMKAKDEYVTGKNVGNIIDIYSEIVRLNKMKK